MSASIKFGPQLAVEALLESVEHPLVLGGDHRFGDGVHQPAEIDGSSVGVKSMSVPYRFTRGRPSATIADDVALDLVGAAAEGQDQARAVHPLDPAAQQRAG